MKEGLLPDGEVLEADIQDLRGSDLEGFEQVHLFAGIGGWPYALQFAGWPSGRPVWTGSCPCQPFSSAGKRQGEDDERHLWPEMFRLIQECGPATVFGEQVSGKLGLAWIDGVFADLESESYACGAADLPAACVGSPQIRQRLFWVACTDGERFTGRQEQDSLSIESGQPAPRRGDIGGCGGSYRLAGTSSNRRKQGTDKVRQRWEERTGLERSSETGGMGLSVGSGLQERGSDRGIQHRERQSPEGEAAFLPGHWNDSQIIQCRDGKSRRIPIEPGLFPLAPGLPGRVGLLRGAGNAIVPQVAAMFVMAFLETARMFDPKFLEAKTRGANDGKD